MYTTVRQISHQTLLDLEDWYRVNLDADCLIASVRKYWPLPEVLYLELIIKSTLRKKKQKTSKRFIRFSRQNMYSNKLVNSLLSKCIYHSKKSTSYLLVRLLRYRYYHRDLSSNKKFKVQFATGYLLNLLDRKSSCSIHHLATYWTWNFDQPKISTLCDRPIDCKTYNAKITRIRFRPDEKFSSICHLATYWTWNFDPNQRLAHCAIDQ